MQDVTAQIRRICAFLVDTPLDSPEAREYRSQLKKAIAALAAQQGEWNKRAESDKHQDLARQPYRSRETDSAEGFADGLKLFNPKKRDSEKKKD
jgi:hypothetical protein